MNVDTGELRVVIESSNKESTLSKISRLAKEMEELQKEGFTPVPPELEPAAIKKLAGQSQAVVSLTSGGKLSKWAAQERKKKRKAAAASRKKNR